MAASKVLGHDDTSGFEFVKRTLGDNVTAAVNFDRLQKDPEKGYIIFEFLKCEESQKVNPYTSHPRKYWYRNASKFLSLWRASQDFGAKLYLVNYAEEHTEHADKVLVIEVLDMDETGITDEIVTRYTIETFSQWFIDMNNQCLEEKGDLVSAIYRNKSKEALGKIALRKGKYKGQTIEAIYQKDPGYLDWHSRQNFEYSKATLHYLKKVREEAKKG